MSNWSNSDLLHYLQQSPGRLRSFLFEVPMEDLQAAIDQKYLNADLIFRSSREQFSYKKNVLDINLSEIVNLCYQENIFNIFQQKLANWQCVI
jgi:hypothetical protein